MQYIDFSPPTKPSPDEQRDALQKGLGRAVQWAIARRLDAELLLDACLHDKRFDAQCEDNRGEWLWKVMIAAGTVERFRDPLLHALRRVADDGDACQLCQLALHYAERGDGEFEACLYDFVERKRIADSPEIGEGQLLELGGEEAFRFLARVRGKLLESRAWDWDNSALMDRATEKFGEGRIAALLDDSSDPAVRNFADAWGENRSKREKVDAQSHRERMRAIPASDVLEAAYGDGKPPWFRAWGMHADRGELETILHVLWTAREPNLIVKLLRVFSKRALPRFDTRLIDLCRHTDEDVRWWALIALEMNAHPMVREFALKELGESSSASAVSLLVRNFVPGDEQRVLEFAKLPEEACHRHSMLLALIKLLQENAAHGAPAAQLGIIAYAHTPCEICRCSAVRLLVGNHSAPTWMLEECRHDSSDECRELV